jgi:hypothetical protein
MSFAACAELVTVLVKGKLDERIKRTRHSSSHAGTR